MAPVFIFTSHIKNVLDAGRKTIEIPKGARISAAAQDLIRDHQIQIHYGGDQGDRPVPELQPDTHPVEEKPSASPLSEMSDAEIENIIRRVIQRFRQIKKGTEPVELPSKPGDPAEGDDLIICRCEEITKTEIREAITNGIQTLNGIKRITRAGMGLCQGQTCQRLVTQILVDELGLNASQIKPTTARAPARPISLAVFATG